MKLDDVKVSSHDHVLNLHRRENLKSLTGKVKASSSICWVLPWV